MASYRDAPANVLTHVPAPPSVDGPGAVSDHIHPGEVCYQYNGASPSPAYASGNPYLQRRPPIAPYCKVTMIPKRPNSSGGLSSKSQANNSFVFDKRISRDDFHLNTRSAGASFTRGQLPTPEESPQSKSYSQHVVPNVRMPTPELLDDTTSIGMAIGSPTHQPTGWVSKVQQQTLLQPAPIMTTNISSAASPVSVTSSVDTFDMPQAAIKKQSSKWKLFGMFRKQSSDNTNATVTISEPNSLNGTHRSGQQQPRLSSETDLNLSRSNTLGRKGPKHKPIVVRSQTLPDADPQNTESLQAYKTRTAANASTDTFATNHHLRSTSNFGSIPIALDTVPGKSSAGCGMLDVEIPSITMERYSVMFGSVLHQQHGPQPASSLLERRQATLNKLKSISDAIEKEEAERQKGRLRGSSSPTPTVKSPGFALFPQPPANRLTAATQKSMGLQRSNTSPAMLHSPLRAQFGQVQTATRETNSSAIGGARTNPTLRPSARPMDPVLEKVPAQVPEVVVPRPSTPPKGYHFGPDTSSFIFESPSDNEQDDEPETEPIVIKSQPVRPSIPSPQWQILNPTTYTSSTASSVTSTRKRSPSPVSSVPTHVTRPSFDLDEPDNIIITNPSNPVEMSIARQISVSRQQRKMLKPLQTAFAQPKRTSPVKQPSPMRLAETKSSTPTLVTPDTAGFNSPQAQHRKSERVVLEGL